MPPCECFSLELTFSRLCSSCANGILYYLAWEIFSACPTKLLPWRQFFFHTFLLNKVATDYFAKLFDVISYSVFYVSRLSSRQ